MCLSFFSKFLRLEEQALEILKLHSDKGERSTIIKCVSDFCKSETREEANRKDSACEARKSWFHNFRKGHSHSMKH
jgi:hypothetical protein